MTGGLLGHHEEFLAARAVAPDVARERGYSSTTLPGWLREQGFSLEAARRTPGLVIPVWDVHGGARQPQYRPDKPRILRGKPAKYERPARARQVIDVPPRVRGRLADPGVPLFITESPVKADAAVSAGLVCVGLFGVWGWRGSNGRGGKTVLADLEYIALNGREVYLVPDSDVTSNRRVAEAVSRLGALLAARDADVRYVCLPHGAGGGKTGLDDYFARGGTVDGLLTLADDEPPARPPAPAKHALPAPPDISSQAPEPCSLAHAEQVASRWLRLADMRPVRALLGAAAAVLLPGDPVWLLMVAAASSAKTELLSALFGLDWVHPAGVLTEAALLSGTSAREKAADATGGLLRRIGDGGRGLIVCKDFGSLLSMQRDTRAATLAALREVYDGWWDRPVGTDGGKVLHWHGHCGLVGGVTPTVDRHHAVIGVLGDRFLLTRIAESDDPAAEAEKALTHSGREEQMRGEIRAAVHGVLASVTAGSAPPRPGAGDTARLVKLAVFTARARTPIDRDGYTGELLSLPAVEGPGRLVNQFARLHAALALIGDPDPMGTVGKVAADCVPAVRTQLAGELLAAGRPLPTSDVADALGVSTKTAARHLEDLSLLRLAQRTKDGPHATAANLWAATGRLTAAAALVPSLEPNVGGGRGGR